MDPQPKVCWFWRRKRERELTFIETKIKSGNRVLEKRKWIAFLSVIMPFEVEIIAMPRPFITFGISSQFE